MKINVNEYMKMYRTPACVFMFMNDEQENISYLDDKL